MTRKLPPLPQNPGYIPARTLIYCCSSHLQSSCSTVHDNNLLIATSSSFLLPLHRSYRLEKLKSPKSDFFIHILPHHKLKRLLYSLEPKNTSTISSFFVGSGLGFFKKHIFSCDSSSISRNVGLPATSFIEVLCF